MVTAGLFITGTDTGVGKTWVTARLTRALRDRGLDVGVWKPVQSGAARGDPAADSYVLKAVGGVPETEAEICPFSFLPPVAPWIAARAAGRKLSVAQLLAAGQLLFPKHALWLVEGAGGLAVPVSGDELVVHLAARLGFPLLLVARPGLGTVNHVLLSVAYARQHGLEVSGVILNGYDKLPEKFLTAGELRDGQVPPDSLVTNPACLEHFSGVPVIGRVPRLEARGVETPIGQYINLEQIVQRITRTATRP
jgi:dethiobiotin synthetase